MLVVLIEWQSNLNLLLTALRYKDEKSTFINQIDIFYTYICFIYIMITLIQLEYIVAIDTYRHFVTAAEKCFVTQPTLSMQIKKLEEQLGVIIFDRSKQPIIPTAIGEKIIEQARKVISESARITEIIKEKETLIEGELTIGIIPSLAPYLLPLFIGKLASNYPLLNITIEELLSEEIIKRLKNDTIDVGLLVTPLNENGIKEESIFYEKMLLYANQKHNLATKKELKTKDLTENGLWLLGKGHCFRSQVINLCSIQNESEKETSFHFESGSLETIKRIIETEGGFTLLPELAIENSIPKDIHVRPFSKENPVREVGIAYSRNQVKKQILNVLVETIRNAVPKEMLNPKRGEIVEWRNT